MSPSDVLRAARKRGVELSAEGERLLIRAPVGVMDDGLRAALKLSKSEILRLLAGPGLDEEGRPLDHCRACGSPNWWTSPDRPGWHCSYCVERPEPFTRGRIVIVAAGAWGIH